MKQKKTMSKRDQKVKIKSLLKAIKAGEELNTDDEEFAQEQDLYSKA